MMKSLVMDLVICAAGHYAYDCKVIEISDDAATIVIKHHHKPKLEKIVKMKSVFDCVLIKVGFSKRPELVYMDSDLIASILCE